jgi:hypothetical protein
VVWPHGKAFLFRGWECVRYDIASDTVDPDVRGASRSSRLSCLLAVSEACGRGRRHALSSEFTTLECLRTREIELSALGVLPRSEPVGRAFGFPETPIWPLRRDFSRDPTADLGTNSLYVPRSQAEAPSPFGFEGRPAKVCAHSERTEQRRPPSDVHK